MYAKNFTRVRVTSLKFKLLENSQGMEPSFINRLHLRVKAGQNLINITFAGFRLLYIFKLLAREGDKIK